MTIAIALWSQELAPGRPIEFVPEVDIKLSNAALGVEVTDETSRSSVRLVYRGPGSGDDAEDVNEEDVAPEATILCSLTPGRAEQATLDLVLEAGQAVAFENLGKNTIYLSGNYIDQIPNDLPPSDDELGLPEDEEGYNLEDASFDVEGDAEEVLADNDDNDNVQIEEPPSPPKKESKKRAREPDARETDGAELSKAERKKLKKLKAEGGEAVPVVVAADIKERAEEKAESKEEKKEKKQDKKAKNEDGAPLKTQELAGGVKAHDKTIGTGPEAKKGDIVTMRYVGKLENGNTFDSNTKGAPFKFKIGAGDVIKGWDVGIAGMKTGGERQLVIPAPMGYGKRKQKDIPANSTLIFDVRLVKIIS